VCAHDEWEIIPFSCADAKAKANLKKKWFYSISMMMMMMKFFLLIHRKRFSSNEMFGVLRLWTIEQQKRTKKKQALEMSYSRDSRVEILIDFQFVEALKRRTKRIFDALAVGNRSSEKGHWR
jgi:hypothetical protein